VFKVTPSGASDAFVCQFELWQH